MLEEDGETHLIQFSTVEEERNTLHTIKERKANCIGHILHRTCLLKQITEGKIRGKHRSDRKTTMTSRKKDDTGNLRRKHYIAIRWKNSLWKRLWTCHKTDYRMNDEYTILFYIILFLTCFSSETSSGSYN